MLTAFIVFLISTWILYMRFKTSREILTTSKGDEEDVGQSG